jgi:large subunit ribosomal protein L6
MPARKPEETRSIQIPKEVDLRVEGRKVTINGEKGMLVRDFSHTPLSIQHSNEVVTIKANWPRKKEAALVNTVYSHIKNMIIGVTEGFTYALKIAFAHFPIKVDVQGKTVLISNFTGERSSRKVRIVGNTKVIVEGDDVIVQGINIENVSQTAANIQQATKTKNKDPRVFLDGIYVYEKKRGMTS